MSPVAAPTLFRATPAGDTGATGSPSATATTPFAKMLDRTRGADGMATTTGRPATSRTPGPRNKGTDKVSRRHPGQRDRRDPAPAADVAATGLLPGATTNAPAATDSAPGDRGATVASATAPRGRTMPGDAAGTASSSQAAAPNAAGDPSDTDPTGRGAATQTPTPATIAGGPAVRTGANTDDGRAAGGHGPDAADSAGPAPSVHATDTGMQGAVNTADSATATDDGAGARKSVTGIDVAFAADRADSGHPVAKHGDDPLVLPGLGGAHSATAAGSPTGATTPQFTPQTNPGQAQPFAQETAQYVSWLVGQGFDKAEIQLNPRDLGPIHVEITQAPDHIDVSFAVQHPQTVNALQQVLPQLHDMLAQHGLNLGQASVGQQSAGHPQHVPSPVGAVGRTAGDRADAGSAPTIQWLRDVAPGRVDDFA